MGKIKVLLLLLVVFATTASAPRVLAATLVSPLTSGAPSYYILDWSLVCSGTNSVTYIPYEGSYPGGTPSAGGSMGACNALTGTSFALSNVPGIFTNASGTYWVNFISSGFDVFVQFDWDGSSVVIAGATRIVSVVPQNNTIFNNSVISTGIDIGATWFVSSFDLQALNTFLSGPENKIHLVQSACPLTGDLTDVSTCIDVLVYELPTGFEESYVESFTESPRTHRSLKPDTDYKLVTDFYGSNFSGLFGDVFRLSTTTYFTVGSTTASQAVGGLSGEVASTTASNSLIDAFVVISSACNPFSSSFSVGNCLLGIIVPPQEQLDNDLTLLQDKALHIFPFGYVTDFVSIVRSTSTISLVVLNATVPPGIPGAGATLSLDLTHGLDYILDATTSTFANESATSTETLGQITLRYWSYIVYLGVILYILRRLFGAHIIPHFGEPSVVTVHEGNQTYLREVSSHYVDKRRPK